MSPSKRNSGGGGRRQERRPGAGRIQPVRAGGRRQSQPKEQLGDPQQRRRPGRPCNQKKIERSTNMPILPKAPQPHASYPEASTSSVAGGSSDRDAQFMCGNPSAERASYDDFLTVGAAPAPRSMLGDTSGLPLQPRFDMTSTEDGVSRMEESMLGADNTAGVLVALAQAHPQVSDVTVPVPGIPPESLTVRVLLSLGGNGTYLTARGALYADLGCDFLHPRFLRGLNYRLPVFPREMPLISTPIGVIKPRRYVDVVMEVEGSQRFPEIRTVFVLDDHVPYEQIDIFLGRESRQALVGSLPRGPEYVNGSAAVGTDLGVPQYYGGPLQQSDIHLSGSISSGGYNPTGIPRAPTFPLPALDQGWSDLDHYSPEDFPPTVEPGPLSGKYSPSAGSCGYGSSWMFAELGDPYGSVTTPSWQIDPMEPCLAPSAEDPLSEASINAQVSALGAASHSWYKVDTQESTLDDSSRAW